MTTSPRHAARALAGLLAAALVVGCAIDGTQPAPAAPAPLPPAASSSPPERGRLDDLLARPLTSRAGDFPAYAATATVDSVAVHDLPRGRVVRTLGHPQPSGAPLVFLVKKDAGPWLEVYLPVRPNGSTGWIDARHVTVAGIPYRVEVHRTRHELVVYERDRVLGRYPVAIGTKDTPTPGGLFYLKELIQPTNPGGFYGPYAYGLSGFSTVLTRFGRGEGVIGIHGTNDESVIGRDVSHGCVRMRNRDITALARLLPLGTPVRILA